MDSDMIKAFLIKKGNEKILKKSTCECGNKKEPSYKTCCRCNNRKKKMAKINNI